MASELDKPKALTPEVQRQVIEFISQGNYFAPACKAAGTTRQTVEYWQRLFNDGVEHAQVYADFFAALEKAQAVAEVIAVCAIQAGANSWQSRAWFLERRFPKRWSAKQKISNEHSGEINTNFRLIYDDRNPDPTAQAARGPTGSPVECK